MKKKISFAVVIMLLCALICIALVGCNENYKQKAIATDNIGTVASNGGMAVKVGKYLYFINGYAGADGDNAFGEVVKGAVMRVDLDESGAPLTDTIVTIVPKNVYHTKESCGLVIMGGYIYYSTPSVEQDGEGNARTSEMVLMRTRLDGTDTKIIAKFKDFDVDYRVTENYIVYVRDSELHVIDLGNKKFKDTMVTDEVVGYCLADYADNANSLQDVVFYTKSAENAYATNNVVWAYKAGGESKVVIDGKDSYKKAENLPHPGGVSITLLDSYFVGNNIRLAYTKNDSGDPAMTTGVYAYDFDATLSFDENKEERYSRGTTYTALNYITADAFLATGSSVINYVKKDNGVWVEKEAIKESSATILSIANDNGVLTVYYTVSNKLKMAIVDTNATEYLIKSVASIYEESYNTTWIKLDKVNDCVYMFNSGVKDNIYYLDLTKVEIRNAKTMIAKKLGKFSDEDNLAMLDISND